MDQGYLIDCFAFNKKSRKPSCTALKKIECEGCRFYKTKETALAENRKCKERAEKHGYKYKSVFDDDKIG